MAEIKMDCYICVCMCLRIKQMLFYKKNLGQSIVSYGYYSVPREINLSRHSTFYFLCLSYTVDYHGWHTLVRTMLHPTQTYNEHSLALFSYMSVLNKYTQLIYFCPLKCPHTCCLLVIFMLLF